MISTSLRRSWIQICSGDLTSKLNYLGQRTSEKTSINLDGIKRAKSQASTKLKSSSRQRATHWQMDDAYQPIRARALLTLCYNKNWFMLSMRISSYGYTRELWRAREKRKSCLRRSRAS